MKTKTVLLGIALFLAGAYAQKECKVIENGKAKAMEAYEYIKKKYLQKNASSSESNSEDEIEK